MTEGLIEAKWTPDNLIHVTSGQDVFLLRPEDGTRVGPAHPRGGVFARRALDRLRHGTRALGLVAGRLERAGGCHRLELDLGRRLLAGLDPPLLLASREPGRGRLGDRRDRRNGAGEPEGSAGGGPRGLGSGQQLGRLHGAERRRPVQATPDLRRERGRHESPAPRSRLRDSARNGHRAGTGSRTCAQVRTRLEDRYYLMLVRPDGSGVHRVMRNRRRDVAERRPAHADVR